MRTLSMSQYEVNRAKIAASELRAVAGQWVAFSTDGRSIVASAPTLSALEEHLAARGEDAQNLAFERIELDDSFVGGAQHL
jgi:hypothetical protein